MVAQLEARIECTTMLYDIFHYCWYFHFQSIELHYTYYFFYIVYIVKIYLFQWTGTPLNDFNVNCTPKMSLSLLLTFNKQRRKKNIIIIKINAISEANALYKIPSIQNILSFSLQFVVVAVLFYVWSVYMSACMCSV